MLINSLGLKNFKCFEELDVKFAPITLLTGANSSGKSSLINAILAVLQTEQFPFYLSPNGKYVNMGSFEEIIRWGATNQKIDIKISDIVGHSDRFYPEENEVGTYTEVIDIGTEWIMNFHNKLPTLQNAYISEDTRGVVNINKTDDNKYNVSYPYRKDFNEGPIAVEFIKYNIQKVETLDRLSQSYKWPTDVEDLLKSDVFYHRYVNENFNYIGAFREVPARTYYQKSKATDKVSTEGLGYIDQIVEWEDTGAIEFDILIDCLNELELLSSIKSSKLKGGRFELNVKTKESANFSSLTDVGFGISQFLPIIVADLQLENMSCLAVSQPEIHLHPKIQAQFGNYLANQIKQSQKQYIVETHSEYLLNRIRLLLVTGELKPEDVRVLYFENDGVKSTVHDVEFATDGQIKGAPQGFFDTYGIDVMNIAMNAVA